MQKARIAVLVSGGGTNLQALINAEQSGAAARTFTTWALQLGQTHEEKTQTR